MTSMTLAALLLSTAIITAPTPARYRLASPVVRRAGGQWPMRGAGGLCAIASAYVVPPLLVLVAVTVVAGILMRRRRRRRAEGRRREGQLVAAALEVLIGELRVGAHPLRAFIIAASESAGPVGESLRSVAARARLGADVVAGFRCAAARSAVPAYWLRLAVFWELAVQHGLPMSVLMRAAHRDIVDRQRFSVQIQASLAGARATALILAGLPALGVLLGHLIGAHPLGFLFGSGVGGFFLCAGVGLIAIGLVWSDHIIDRLVT